MLVLHPKDRTTAMLSILYQGEQVDILEQSKSTHEIEHALHHCSKYERIMLLGHGTDKGLFSRKDDTINEFDRIIVGHPHAYHLRHHGGNLVGIWCHADMFARKEGLHGLFSGMIISEKSEAEEYGIITLQQHIDEENEIMFNKLRRLLDEECPLHEVPDMMKELNVHHNDITDFNYNNFFYF